MFKTPRGTQDILPEEQPYWRFIEEKVYSLCSIYGYQRIDTPVFEQTGLFFHGVGGVTDIVEKEMYTFEDQGGEQMTLRPEGTAPVCRAYIEHGMYNRPQPVKLFYISPIFRYERPQAGRFRQHHQFGCEALGSDDPTVDAEVIDMAWQIYRSLGLQGLTLLLNSIGCQKCRPGYLDKLKGYYTGYSQRLCRDCKVRLERNTLRLLDCKEPACQDIASNAPRIIEHLCPECDDHFKALREYLERLQIPYTIDNRLVRGLDYYTRTVFEIQPEGGGAQSTIGGGGRYDNLIDQLGGRPTPAVGFATGMERIILNMRQQNVVPLSDSAVKVYVACLGEEARKEMIGLSSRLRRAGVKTALASGDKSLKAQLKLANTLEAEWAVIAGEEEIKKGVVMLRDMAKGEQREISYEEVVKTIADDNSKNIDKQEEK
jgi:histidyl-tRNA synthetase